MATAPQTLEADKFAKLEKCLDIIEEDRKSTSKEWRFEKEVAPGVQCHSIAVEGTGLRKFRAQGMIPSPPDVVAPLLWDPSTRLGWDTSYGDDQQIQVYASPNPGKDEIEVHRLCIKAVLVVSQRDFINLTLKRIFPDGSIASVSYSIPHDSCPVDPAYVRGDVMPGSAWHLEPVRAKQTITLADGSTVEVERLQTRMTYCILTDIKGWVPQWTVNAAVAQTFTLYYNDLRKHLASHPELLQK